MSNRKESIKKSLGLTEYPWSSDDEETPCPSQSAPTTSRRPPDSHDSRNSSAPGTSGPASSLFPLRRTQAKLEQELFWSLITSDKRMMSTEPPRPSTSSYTPPQIRESIDLDSPVSNFQRIFAIKRLTRTLNPNRFNKTNCPNMSSLQRASCSPRRAGGARSNTARRRPRTQTDYTRNSIIPAVMESDGISPPDDVIESPERSLLQANPDNGNADEQENNDDDTAEVGIPEVEEVVEIDAETEDNQADEANDENQDQASADEDPNEEIVPINIPDDAQVPQGIKRKREPHELEPSTGKEFNQSLLRLLECPVCLEWMEPPMSQCRRGHLVCGRCRARLAACPVCRTAFSSVRNRAMEAVAEMLRYPCRHGCGRETRLRRRGVHEANCAARRYRCPAPTCADRPPLALADLPHHFQTRHLSMLKVGRKHKFSMKVNTEQHDHWLVMAARELFHLRVDVDIRTWGVDVYVAYIGPKCNAAKYTYEVTVLGQHNDRKLVYTRATHSDLESSSLNVSRQDCFHLTLDQALNFLRFKNRHCVPDKFLDFTVEINKSEVAVVTARGDSDS